MKRSPIKRKPPKDKRSPEEKTYFEWLRGQPCAVTGRFESERSHIRRLKYGAGTSRKPPDWFCIPMHPDLHRQLHKGDRTWELRFGRQETYLLKVWEAYGLERIPEDIRRMVDGAE